MTSSLQKRKNSKPKEFAAKSSNRVIPQTKNASKNGHKKYT